jgi:hypothetical protein
MRRFLLFALTLAACKSASPVEAFPPAKLVLEPGKADSSNGIYVTLLKVENDSRCPSNVVCVWQGDAEVSIGVSSNRLDITAPFVLHTGVEPRAGIYNGYQIRLDSLTPAPVAGQPIPASEYRAWISVKFMPD